MPEQRSKCPPEAAKGQLLPELCCSEGVTKCKNQCNFYLYLFSCDTGKSSNFQSGLKLKSPDPVSTSIILRRLNLWRNFMAFTGGSVHMRA
jgi:hypothetical protein